MVTAVDTVVVTAVDTVVITVFQRFAQESCKKGIYNLQFFFLCSPCYVCNVSCNPHLDTLWCYSIGVQRSPENYFWCHGPFSQTDCVMDSNLLFKRTQDTGIPDRNIL